MTDIDTDPFLELLGEALRAGPDSAPWREAVAQLRDVASGADEYQLLLAAREHLEGGRKFREIHAGAGFTRKVMEGIEQDGGGGRGRGAPVASVIAIFAAIGIILALGWLGYHLTPRPDVSRARADDLANTYLPTDAAVAHFAGSTPAGWRQIGTLPLDLSGGVKPRAGDELMGGGVVTTAPLAASDTFAVEAELQVGQPSDKIVVQVFVASSDDFSADRATSSHELLWSLRGSSQQVVLDGGVLPIGAGAIHAGILHVRIVMNKDMAIVEAAGKRLWAGPHGLGAEGPRWLGARFIRGGAVPTVPVTIKTLRVVKK